MRDLLPPIFSILTGLAFLAVLAIGVFARSELRSVAGRFTAFAVLASAVGFFLMSRATGAGSLGAGAGMFIAAGVSLFVTVALIVAAVFVRARSAGSAGAQ